jgi:hypothetical protein
MSMSLNEFYQPLPNIALIGKRRAGKDTVNEILDTMGFDTKRVAFGDPLKQKLFEVIPDLPREPKPVEAMVIFGQACRKIDPDIWVKYTIGNVLRQIDFHKNAGLRVPTYVFTDVRQPNELEACQKQLDCITVRIDTPEEIRVKRMLAHGETVTRESLDAYTETALDEYKADYTLKNDGTLEDLQKEITEMIIQIQNKRMDK